MSGYSSPVYVTKSLSMGSPIPNICVPIANCVSSPVPLKALQYCQSSLASPALTQKSGDEDVSPSPYNHHPLLPSREASECDLAVMEPSGFGGISDCCYPSSSLPGEVQCPPQVPSPQYETRELPAEDTDPPLPISMVSTLPASLPVSPQAIPYYSRGCQGLFSEEEEVVPCGALGLQTFPPRPSSTVHTVSTPMSVPMSPPEVPHFSNDLPRGCQEFFAEEDQVSSPPCTTFELQAEDAFLPTARGSPVPLHYSNGLPRGCQEFVVQEERFMLPTSILARIGGSLYDLSIVSNGKPVSLQCSADAFETFVELIFEPWASCLAEEKSSLKRILEVLQISSKYGAHGIADRVRPKAIQMTRQDVIMNHIQSDLTAMDIFRVANESNVGDMAKTAWDVILALFRSGSITARQLLDQGFESGSENYIVSAYYEVMLTGRAKWQADPSLNAIERQNLRLGMLGCIEEWDAFVSRLSIGCTNVPLPTDIPPPFPTNPVPVLQCSPPSSPATSVAISERTIDYFEAPAPVYWQQYNYHEELGAILKAHVVDGIQPYDVLRKLHSITAGHEAQIYEDRIIECARHTIPFMKSRLPKYFLTISNTQDLLR